MKCEYCNEEHDGSYASGRFCNTKCARSYSRSKDKKETKIVKCITCNKKIEVDKRASKKQCKCDNCRKYKKSERKKKERKILHCLNCKTILIKRQRKYCTYKCQQDFKYKEYIRKWKNDEVDGSKIGSVPHPIRRYIFEKYNNKCCECGWNKINPISKKIPLQIEHIDGNSENSKEENLKLLCPNCHSLTPTYMILNKGNGRKHRYKNKTENKNTPL